MVSANYSVQDIVGAEFVALIGKDVSSEMAADATLLLNPYTF